MHFKLIGRDTIQEDEYVEVTPKALRLRKIQLDFNERERTRKSAMA